MGEHFSEYIIKNNVITIFYNDGFAPGRTDTKKISSEDMEELLSILNEAININAFETANTIIMAEHDFIYTYDYDYGSISGRDCGGLFTDDSLAIRYRNLIDKITK